MTKKLKMSRFNMFCLKLNFDVTIEILTLLNRFFEIDHSFLRPNKYLAISGSKSLISNIKMKI